MRFITVKHYFGIDPIDRNTFVEKIINIDLIVSIAKHGNDERFYEVNFSGSTGLIIDRQAYDRICYLIGVSL